MINKAINILLIENDESEVMRIRRAFERNDIRNPLYVASDGMQALSTLRRQDDRLPLIPTQRRLILLELLLPKMSGIEFLQALRADPQLKSIPVVVFTRSNAERNQVDAYQHHVAGYLLKPITFEHLVENIAVLNKYWSMCEMI